MLEIEISLTLNHTQRELICVALTHQAVLLDGFAADAGPAQASEYRQNAQAMRSLVAQIDAEVTERFRAALK